jgi:Fungal specific transcription factor domain
LLNELNRVKNSLAKNPGPKNALSRTIGISRHGNKESKVPAVFFLDSKLFQHSQMVIPNVTLPAPLSVVSLIGDTTAIRLVASQYFESIHIWLPFISKIRFYKNVLNPLSQLRADVALLVLCMKLITESPSQHEATDDPQTRAYLTAKRFLLDLELTGILTLQVSQACILLTLYELGHAIYPSAYISIGTCARYVMALSINGKKGPYTTDASVWMKQEEQRRTWWAVVIFDRFVPFSRFQCSDPELLLMHHSILALQI